MDNAKVRSRLQRIACRHQKINLGNRFFITCFCSPLNQLRIGCFERKLYRKEKLALELSEPVALRCVGYTPYFPDPGHKFKFVPRLVVDEVTISAMSLDDDFL